MEVIAVIIVLLIVILALIGFAVMQLRMAGIEFDGENFFEADAENGKTLSLDELGRESVNGQRRVLSAIESFSGQSSPPPFVAGFAEVEVDTLT